jgi:quinol monooxygenase YgiN
LRATCQTTKEWLMAAAEPVVIVATFLPKPEARERVIAALEAAVAKTHTEPGCELYALHENEDRLVMIEKYASQEAADQHGKGEAVRELVARLDGALAKPFDVVFLRPHPGGDPARGAL